MTLIVDGPGEGCVCKADCLMPCWMLVGMGGPCSFCGCRRDFEAVMTAEDGMTTEEANQRLLDAVFDTERGDDCG